MRFKLRAETHGAHVLCAVFVSPDVTTYARAGELVLRPDEFRALAAALMRSPPGTAEVEIEAPPALLVPARERCDLGTENARLRAALAVAIERLNLAAYRCHCPPVMATTRVGVALCDECKADGAALREARAALREMGPKR